LCSRQEKREPEEKRQTGRGLEEMNNDDELCDNNGNSSKDERNGQKKTPRLRKNEDGHIKV